jgi:hypothetical protein
LAYIGSDSAEAVTLLSCVAVKRSGAMLLLILVGGCGEVTSLDLRSPGNPAAKADLLPGPIDAPERAPLDELLQMRVGVSNTGNLTAGPGWTIRVFLSDDSIIDPADHQIDQFVTTRELPAGGQDSYLRNKKLSGVGPGQYYLGSIIDGTEVVPELNENNNTLSSPGVITLLPKAPSHD